MFINPDWHSWIDPVHLSWLTLRVIKENWSFAVQSLHFGLPSFASHTSLLPRCGAIYRPLECTHTHVWLIIWLSFTSLLYSPPLSIRYLHLPRFRQTPTDLFLHFTCSLFEYFFLLSSPDFSREDGYKWSGGQLSHFPFSSSSSSFFPASRLTCPSHFLLLFLNMYFIIPPTHSITFCHSAPSFLYSPTWKFSFISSLLS